MNLHEDRYAFRSLLEQTHDRTGYRTDVLEKDYYVVLMLHELAEKRFASLFQAAARDDAVRRAYAVMQEQYVLRAEDRIEYGTAMTALSEIHNRLMQNRAWIRYEPSKEVLHHIRQEESESVHDKRNQDDMER